MFNENINPEFSNIVIEQLIKKKDEDRPNGWDVRVTLTVAGSTLIGWSGG